MPTLTGGQTVATSGVTAADEVLLTQALASITAPNSTVTVQAPVTPTEPAQQLVNTIQIGSSKIESVQTVEVKSTTSDEGVEVAQVTIPTSTNANTVTNIVVDDNVDSVIISGTPQGGASAVFVDTSAGSKVIAGDSGNNFVVLSGGKEGAVNTVATGIGNDSVIGSSGQDSVSAAGDSLVFAGGGADTLVGGEGSATLGGGDGADSIAAGSGGGFLIGGSGSDTLAGGAGADVMIYSPGDGNDSIVGFDPTKDVIGFASTAFTGGTLDIGALIANARVEGGNTVITLPDGSTITVSGLTGIDISWFTPKG
ncbi:MAG TPA: hypothetical protein VEH84_07515 [Alphaproteobacteria bacterium]|nr:hypothetical protein [Alphaproteobacteria bacterium]